MFVFSFTKECLVFVSTIPWNHGLSEKKSVSQLLGQCRNNLNIYDDAEGPACFDESTVYIAWYAPFSTVSDVQLLHNLLLNSYFFNNQCQAEMTNCKKSNKKRYRPASMGTESSNSFKNTEE